MKPHIKLHRYPSGRAYWRVTNPMGKDFKHADRTTQDQHHLAHIFINKLNAKENRYV